MSGTLRADRPSVEQGETVSYDYAVDAGQVTPKNWVALFPRGGEPAGGKKVGQYATWVYAPQASGRAALGTGTLTPGDYVGCYLYDDGYTALADPVPLTVRAVAPVPPPSFVRAFGRSGRLPGQLDRPGGLAVDPSGRIWVADTGNDRVQAFTPDGRPAGLAGIGVLAAPEAVAVDGTGAVFVADTGHDRAVRLDRAGRVVRVYGAGALGNPRGIALEPGGGVLVSDTAHQRVARFDRDTGALTASITASMSGPQGVAVAPDGEIRVVQSGHRDSGANGVVRYRPDGTVAGTVGGGQNSKFGGLSNPAFVAAAGDELLVSVPDYGWVARFRVTGPFLGTIGTDGPGALRFPLGVATGPGRTVYVADTGHDRIVVLGGVG